MTEWSGKHAVAVAHPNIALAKYWGKLAQGTNLPAVPSLSLTLAGMSTRTEVRIDDALEGDRLTLDGHAVEGRPLARVSQLLDLVWAGAGTRSGRRPPAMVVSTNDFPTAGGLASSASAFAALAVAADGALGTGHSIDELSSLARAVSASAGRSLFGGFVELPAGVAGEMRLSARALAPVDHWPLRLLVAVTAEGPKAVGSTEGMIHTVATSPYFDAWVAWAPQAFERIRQAVLARDLDALGPLVEQSALAMHATAMASDPGLLYWNGATLDVIHAVRRLQGRGLAAYFTIDAGPHVKVVTLADQVNVITAALTRVPGVRRVITTCPGGPARLVSDGLMPDGERG